MNQDILRLRKQLHQLNHQYYVLSQPAASDADYDQLLAQLAELELRHPEDFDPNSPTQRVGSDVTNTFAKVRHAVPMLSLGNNFTADEIVASFPAVDLIVEWKIDGLSLSLCYVNGRLERAVTRGDGTAGDDVTANARTIRNIPLELPEPVTVEVRGEVYMKRSVFAALNDARAADGDEPFANPRNAASGTLKQKDSAEVARRQLSFVAYQGFGDAVKYAHQGGMLVNLHRLGFETTQQLAGGVTLLPALEQAAARSAVIEAEINRRTPLRDTLDFDVDGLVFKVRVTAVQEELGLGSKTPKWATAFKFPPERKATILESITVQVGRTGVLTPVANLAPVSLAGAVVRRASLCNQDEVRRLQINVGDEVFVERAAEVIPKVVGLSRKLSTSPECAWEMPKVCPCCGTAVVRQEGFVAYKCPNKDCKDQAIERMRHAVGKSSLDWDGFGDAQALALISAGYTNLSSLFAIDEERVKLLLKGSAARKFLKERERVKSQPLWRKLHALGIEMLGTTSCKELASRFASIEEICEHAEETSAILGEVRAAKFWAAVNELVDEIAALDNLGLRFAETRVTGVLSCKTFCITGTLMSGTRDQVAKRIEDAGGLVKGSVGKTLSYLVMGEAPGANKALAAKKYNVPVINEEQLYALIGIPMPTPPPTPDERDY